MFASKGQEGLFKELDRILEHYNSSSVQKVAAKSGVLDDSVAKETAPSEMTAPGPKREMMEERSAAYWTTLALNVEDYSGCVAKMIAKGSAQLIEGILWCGDVTVDRLKWGNDMLKSRLQPNLQLTEINKETLRRMKRVEVVHGAGHGGVRQRQPRKVTNVLMDGSSSDGKRLVLILLPSLVAGVLLLGIAAFLLKRRIYVQRKRKKNAVVLFVDLSVSNGLVDKDIPELPLIDFSTIVAATSNFSDANKLGEGGFGPVYKVGIVKQITNAGKGLKQ